MGSISHLCFAEHQGDHLNIKLHQVESTQAGNSPPVSSWFDILPPLVCRAFPLEGGRWETVLVPTFLELPTFDTHQGCMCGVTNHTGTCQQCQQCGWTDPGYFFNMFFFKFRLLVWDLSWAGWRWAAFLSCSIEQLKHCNWCLSDSSKTFTG